MAFLPSGGGRWDRRQRLRRRGGRRRLESGGCRGLVDDPNTTAETEVLQKYGLSLDDILKRYRIFLGATDVAKEKSG